MIKKVDMEYGRAFGRSYGGMAWDYEMEDAELVLVAMGSLATEATVAADILRGQGYKAGVLGLRVYRPFPREEVRQAAKKAKTIVIFDKNISYGYEGATCSDFKAALYGSGIEIPIHNYIAGLGGRDVKARELVEAAAKSLQSQSEGKLQRYAEWLNCQI